MPSRIHFPESNQSQQYATHDYFRYFGKLPPVVVSHILDEGEGDAGRGPVLDLMCGSGTTLVECMIRGSESVGIDINPLSVLVSKAKTTVLDPNALRDILSSLRENVASDRLNLNHGSPFKANGKPQLSYLVDERPKIGNKAYWFSERVEADLVILRHHINQIDEEDMRNFFTVAFLSIIRRISNASNRIGRIFHIGYENERDAIEVFSDRAKRMIDSMEKLRELVKTSDVKVLCEDARNTSLDSGSVGLILNHPPYFALYKYSSDVLRFELEWGGFNRRNIARGEITDGFKTTRLDDFDRYADDMEDVLREGYRLLHSGGLYCLVVNDSTLRDVRLPVTKTLLERASGIGFSLHLHEIRSIKFSQATYHKSARSDKVTDKDHLIFLRK